MSQQTPEHPLRVLIVDNDAQERQLAREALQQASVPMTVEEADTLALALEKLTAGGYDAALLDLSLSGGDGLALLHLSQARGLATPLIMLTGPADEMLAAQLLQAGAADAIPKSKVTPDSLTRAVQNVQRLHRMQDQARDADTARRDSETRFRRVAESNIVSIVFWEADGTVTDANDAFLAMTGCAREDIAAGDVNWRRMTLPEYHALDEERITELMLTGMCAPWEKEMRGPDGRLVAVLVSASFLEPEGHKGLAFLVDVTERKRAQDAQKFLAEASAALSASPDYARTLEEVSRLAVPTLADWCIIDLVENGALRRVALVGADPALEARARDMDARTPQNLHAPDGPGEVVRTGHSEMVADIPDTLIAANAQSDEQLAFLREIGCRSYLCVPLTARERTLGAITFIHGASGRRYTPQDLLLAESLGQRMALAVDNARLLFETQARAEREAVVNAIGRALRASLDTGEILQGATREVGQALRAARCFWCWVSPAQGSLEAAPQQYAAPGVAACPERFFVHNAPSPVFGPWTGNAPLVFPDFAQDAEAAALRSFMPDGWDIGALLACPVKLRGDGDGVFVVAQCGEARAWTADEVALLRQASDLLSLALENAHLYEREHRVADMLQAAFLSNIPDTLATLELATVYRAGLAESQVGGDCYDAFALPDGRIALTIADVSGKGLSAAVLTATVKYSLRAFAAEVAAPSLVLTRLNRMLASEGAGLGEHFVTLFYAVFDPSNGRLTYASAGHETQLIKRRAGGTTWLGSTGPILGIADHLYEQQEEHLQPGDALALYTDGLTEARNPDTRALLDVQRVADLLDTLPAALGAGGLCARLERLALDWAQGRPHDDMALLIARRAPPVADLSPEVETKYARQGFVSSRGADKDAAPPGDACLFHFHFPSLPDRAADVRQAVAHWMDTLGFSRLAVQDFLTAVTEAVVNAVRHGSPNGERDQFAVAAYRLPDDALLVEVTDTGPGLQGRDTAPPMPTPEAPGGRGLPLMRACADSVEYVPTASGLCVRLRKAHSVSAPPALPGW